MFYDIYKNSSLSATFPGRSEAVTVILPVAASLLSRVAV
jgi:hypothetical protein